MKADSYCTCRWSAFGRFSTRFQSSFCCDLMGRDEEEATDSRFGLFFGAVGVCQYYHHPTTTNTLTATTTTTTLTSTSASTGPSPYLSSLVLALLLLLLPRLQCRFSSSSSCSSSVSLWRRCSSAVSVACGCCDDAGGDGYCCHSSSPQPLFQLCPR